MDNRKKADLILHPVRLRIITALSRENRTARQIAGLVPDIPQATLYRHLKSLETAGLILVVESRTVRGALEKTYGLASRDSAEFSAEDVRSFTPEDHQKYFSAFLGSLFDSFMGTVSRLDDHPELLNRLGYRTRRLSLPKETLPDFQKEYLSLLQKYESLEGEKESFLLSTVLVPEVDYDESY
ncbi:MAG: helix-turn-helix domain-containing protein [Spirochaetales bacterium]|nr:helix-turn-helix domain-containing protein [Spirochaetales bacterium]